MLSVLIANISYNSLAIDGITLYLHLITTASGCGRAAGRIAAHGADAQARRASTQRRNALANWGWLPSSLPAWLNEETYVGKVQPLLARVTTSAVAEALGVSRVYAIQIRAGLPNGGTNGR